MKRWLNFVIYITSTNSCKHVIIQSFNMKSLAKNNNKWGKQANIYGENVVFFYVKKNDYLLQER